MTRDVQNNISNEFNVPKSVKLEVSHLHDTLDNNKISSSYWMAAAIFDLAITHFVAWWQASTSVIFHVWGPIDSF